MYIHICRYICLYICVHIYMYIYLYMNIYMRMNAYFTKMSCDADAKMRIRKYSLTRVPYHIEIFLLLKIRVHTYETHTFRCI